MANPVALAQSDLYKHALFDFTLSKAERLELSHARSKALVMSFGYTAEDIFACSEKFWNSGLCPLNILDVGAFALATIQVNLAVGTLAEHVHRPEIAELCRKLLAFEISGHYMLTEVNHGLDSQNIETTATLLDDGGFELHTPHAGAGKFMPASVPAGGIPRMTIVLARLIGKTGSFMGIRPFAVDLNDGKTMKPGVSCRVLPDKTGTRPVGHAITYFDRVKLPATALISDLDAKTPPRTRFLLSIWRLGIGSVFITGMVVPALRIAAHIAAKYAAQRMVTNSAGETAPILSFRTTQAPILQALAQAAVIEAFYKEIRPYYSLPDNSRLAHVLNDRNGITGVFKTIAIHCWRETSVTLTDRLGARGLFNESQVMSMDMELRGVTIAEGDILVLCIRLASELLIGRYGLPSARYPNTLLAKYERGIFEEMRTVFQSIGGDHRSQEFNQLLLPRCVPLITAIGYRMAFEAAIDAHVQPELVRLFEAGAILRNVAWYIENGLVTRKAAMAKEVVALNEAFAILDMVLAENGCEPFIYAPIMSSSAWENWVETLPLYASKL
ncbi:Acyl-CoA oxidase [Mycena indigotica]|uniref:Acyl-CoA oxidase n=1 Tax=Mycena indigotica TaxID=2126181 RepID=A0A8H6SM92_9AGAR|nr:Acyl-CoA oxidase [Mycena indigotica]KAF7301924.1 Acyl-CoA oxidase [Mycena indigotica]